ncbi:MAG: hypothetical protein ABI685_10285 [Ferruginibacter sp.]
MKTWFKFITALHPGYHHCHAALVTGIYLQNQGLKPCTTKT